MLHKTTRYFTAHFDKQKHHLQIQPL